MTTKENPIGVFDSGVGGLTVLRALREALPQEDFVYLGDTARLPYGTKGADTVTQYALQAARLLMEHDIKLLVVACNTATALALPQVQKALPHLPCLGVIDSGARQAAATSATGRIAVLSTEGTARSGAYAAAIRRYRADAEVQSLGCNLLVALAEEGWCEGAETEAVIARYLAQLSSGYDTLVLGCTHFPALLPALRNLLPDSVRIIDSATTTAATVRTYLIEHNLQTERLRPPPLGAGSEAGAFPKPPTQNHPVAINPAPRGGEIRFLATDAPERFAALAHCFLGERNALSITHIHLMADPSATLMIERYPPDMILSSALAGQKFAVLGLGKSGLATAAFLRASQADVTVWDDKPAARERAAAEGFALGDLAQMDLAGFEALVLSPGIPHSFPKPHPVAARFRERHIPIIGDIELLFRACPEATYVGITGTNGKSTTTALIAHILKQAGRNVQVGGNLGTPALSLKPLGKDGIYVLELSSYQLELIEQNRLSVAVLLNITPDHIDRHGDMAGYIAAKKRILRAAEPQTLVIGSDEPETRAVAAEARNMKHLTVKDVIVDCLPSIVDPATLPTLPGEHNWQNAYAAYLACRALDVPAETIVKGLQSFPGLDHRQQKVGEIGGIRFINDSKATNADAASKALACYDDIYWIIGGLPKAGGLAGLEGFAPRLRHAFIIGQASADFAAWCAANHVPHTLCGTLDLATAKAAEAARRDGITNAVVLLSPACASWDQFASFEDRGAKFAAYVEDLKAA